MRTWHKKTKLHEHYELLMGLPVRSNTAIQGIPHFFGQFDQRNSTHNAYYFLLNITKHNLKYMKVRINKSLT